MEYQRERNDDYEIHIPKRFHKLYLEGKKGKAMEDYPQDIENDDMENYFEDKATKGCDEAHSERDAIDEDYAKIFNQKKNSKINYLLIEEMIPAIELVAKIMTDASASGHHYQGEWLEESPEHQLECFNRHYYEDRKGNLMDEEFGKKYPHFGKALCRYLMYVSKKLKSTRNLMEAIR